MKERLDRHLGTVNTLLILFGEDELTIAVHARAKELKANDRLEDNFVPLRVKDLTILTPTQKRDWSASPGRYVVTEPDANAVRQAVVTGPIRDLTTVQGNPSNLKIKRAFRGGS
jgi:hypothetical protein